jgi:hypothetical protein
LVGHRLFTSRGAALFLPQILSYATHDRDIYPDGAVWFKTEYAYYKLGEASDKYKHIWRPFLQKYQIGKRIMLIVSSTTSFRGLA